MFFLSITKPFISNKTQLAIKHKKKKTLCTLFIDGVQLPSRLEQLRGGSLLFITKFPEVPGTYFINLGKMNG